MPSDEDLTRWRAAKRLPVATGKHAASLPGRLSRALNKGEEMEIVYYGGSTPGQKRRIRPLRVYRVHGYDPLYLDAYCYKRGEKRTFRVEKVRIGSSSLLAKGSRPSSGCMVSVFALLGGMMALAIVIAIIFQAIK